jgi:hypothetical protein
MFGFLNKLGQQADAINDYFADAAKIYAFLCDADAGVAALTAAKVAASTQRQSMVEYCTGFASDIDQMAPDASKRLIVLSVAIQEKDWSMNDVTKAKAELYETDREMAIALDRANGSYFRQVHAEFFRDF